MVEGYRRRDSTVPRWGGIVVSIFLELLLIYLVGLTTKESPPPPPPRS